MDIICLHDDAQLLAQLSVNGAIINQTEPVGREPAQPLWNLKGVLELPVDSPSFSIAIIYENAAEGTEQIGSVELFSQQIIADPVEQKRELLLKLIKQDDDGPSLELALGFSVSLNYFSPINQDTVALGSLALYDVKSLVSDEGIAFTLQQMLMSAKDGVGVDSGVLAALYGQLVLPSMNQTKCHSLNMLGDIYFKRYHAFQAMDDLNQAVASYEGAAQSTSNNNMKVPYLSDFGTSLFHRFEQLGHLDDINKSVLAFEDTVCLMPDAHPSKPSQLINLGNSLLSRFEQLGDLNDINKAVSTFEDAVHLTSDDHPDKSSSLNSLSGSLFQRFEHFGDLDDINQSILILKNAVHLIPDDCSDKFSWLSSLGNSLLSRFEQLGNLDDIHESISIFKDALHLTPDGHSNKPLGLKNIGISLLQRFERLGDLDDINKSIMALEDAVHLTPDDNPYKSSQLNSLGNSLLERFKQLGNLSDLKKSVSVFEDAVHLTSDDHPNRPIFLSNLSNSLFYHFQQLGDVDDINKSILILEDIAPDNPNKVLGLANLGSLLLARFMRLGDINDINRSVLMQEDAVRLTPDNHPDKPSQLNNLGTSLFCRFQQLDDFDDMNKSILLFRDAVHLTPDGHPEKPSWLNNLGNALSECFGRLGELDHINESISILEDAVCLTPDSHPDKSSWLSNLGTSLLRRFEYHGDLDDINKSILTLENTMHLTPDGHSNKPAQLKNLGISLLCRFNQLGDLDDINKSVLILEDAVHLTPDDHPIKYNHLDTLSNSLLCRFERLGDLDDINRSVLMKEEAVHLSPDNHPKKPSWLNNLGVSLLRRFEHLGELDDINKSISILENAVHLIPDRHPSRPSWLGNLSNSLLCRFEQLGDFDDMNKSVLMSKDAVHLTPDGHPDKPSWLNNLGNAFACHFDKHGDTSDLEQTILCYTSAACSTTGPPSVRFQASLEWARHANISQHPSLLHAYAVAIDLLPQLAWLGLSLSDRHYHLLNAGQIVRDAVAAAIGTMQYEKAIEWLEQGRSVIWGQVLQLRTPVDDLKQKHPHLAHQLVQLSWKLESACTRNSFTKIADSDYQQSLESVAQRYHDLAHEWDELVKEIRKLEGFNHFLLPKCFLQLTPAASAGPVVIVNVSNIRCDALVLMPNLHDVLHIPLEEFTYKDSQTLHKSLRILLPNSGRCIIHGDNRGFKFAQTDDHHKDPEAEIEHILSQLWFHIVKPVLDGLAITDPSSANISRMWWCPTGPLAFLPIHAAGLYGANKSLGSKLSDFVVSSYTPTLTALLKSSDPTVLPKKQLLVVSLPSESRLPGAKREIDIVKEHAGHFPILQLLESNATVGEVEKGMEQSSWVHFACHAVQSFSQPMESAFLLAGASRLSLSRITQLSLPHADLAFLSACQTATGTEDLAEESVHLAAGMLLVGYHGVIATMWSIMDSDAPQVADEVYTHLFKEIQPDPTEAAQALHIAVKKLYEDSREEKSFLSWVPFIHFGV